MTAEASKRALRVGLISLGCAKNLVDAEIMLGSLLKDGVEITNDPVQADALIVNTCSFIDEAQEESVDAILESDQLRQVRHPSQALIVSGCLPQRFRDQLPTLLPEVDAFMGIDQVAQVTQIVTAAINHRRAKAGQPAKPNQPSPGSARASAKATPRAPKLVPALTSASDVSKADAAPLQVNHRPEFIPDVSTPRYRLTPGHFAYLKIAEGCNHPCSFCIIPRMRGTHRSRPQPDIVAEARKLIDE